MIGKIIFSDNNNAIKLLVTAGSNNTIIDALPFDEKTLQKKTKNKKHLNYFTKYGVIFMLMNNAIICQDAQGLQRVLEANDEQVNVSKVLQVKETYFLDNGDKWENTLYQTQEGDLND